MMASVTKDRKGDTYFVSHVRCGATEGVFLTFNELLDIRDMINDIERHEKEDFLCCFEEGTGKGIHH